MTKKSWVLLLLAVFAFRFLFGLFNAKWQENDELQTYLIGLKQYTTQTWPYFGPDLTGSETAYTSQIPGAMEGLLIGLSFKVLPIPEAPYIFLNLLSAIGVTLLAWYISKRLPELSPVWLLIWIAFAPWSLNEGTHVINPAYLLFPSVLFFIGFLESFSPTRLVLIPYWLANALMGFSVVWCMQFHTSYVYLLPFVLLSLVGQFKEKRYGAPLYLFLGALPMLALLIPTYLQYGFSQGGAALGFLSSFNIDGVKAFLTILARYLSIVCLEMPRFIDTSTKTRLNFLEVHWWLFLPGVVLWILGLVQPFLLIWKWSDKKGMGRGWVALKWLALLAFVMVWTSFWFTTKAPLAHIYFILFPLLMVYSCEIYAMFANDRLWSMAAKVVLVLAVYFQMGYALAVIGTNSLYPQRDKVVQALSAKDYHVLGERYPGSKY